MRLTLESLPMHVDEFGECWLWKHSRNSTGYPQMSVGHRGGVLVKNHIFTELLGATVPSRRWCVVMSCGERACVRPEHIALRSRSANLRAAYKDGSRMGPMEYARRLNGSRHLAKLTQQQVDEIRARDPGETHTEIAREYGVTLKTISEIRRGITWRRAVPSSSVFSWRPAA